MRKEQLRRVRMNPMAERDFYHDTLSGIISHIRRELGGRAPRNRKTILYHIYVAAARAVGDNARPSHGGPSSGAHVGAESSATSKLNGGRTQRASGASR